MEAMKANDFEAIVEEVRGRGMSTGPSQRVHRFPGSLDEGERRMHCLRGMKPQGPAVLSEAADALNR